MSLNSGQHDEMESSLEDVQTNAVQTNASSNCPKHVRRTNILPVKDGLYEKPVNGVAQRAGGSYKADKRSTLPVSV